MARAKRVIYNGNGSNSVDYYPVQGGVAKWFYTSGGIRIPHWNATGGAWRPTSAMTSETAPAPYVVTYSSRYSLGYTGYLAFNKSYSDAYGWVADSTDTQPWIMLKMDVALKSIVIHSYNRTRSSLVNGWKSGVVYGSDNGSTFYQIGSFSGRNGATSGAGYAMSCDNHNDAFQYVKIVITDWERRGLSTDKYCAIGEIYIGGKYAS